jgi:hypothetical protein
MNASDNTPGKGESVSDAPTTTNPAYHEFFQAHEDVIYDRARQARKAVDRENFDVARRELEAIQAEAEALMEMISDE